MTTIPEPATETVRVHETPYVLRVEIDLPDGQAPMHVFAVTSRGLEIPIFHTIDEIGHESGTAPAHTSEGNPSLADMPFSTVADARR